MTFRVFSQFLWVNLWVILSKHRNLPTQKDFLPEHKFRAQEKVYYFH